MKKGKKSAVIKTPPFFDANEYQENRSVGRAFFQKTETQILVIHFPSTFTLAR
jgi:hypothetical protein